MRVWPGRPYPLGATWDGGGVNFAIFSEHARRAELCLFGSPQATRASHRVRLPEYTDHVWHGYLPDLAPGQLYGYRMHGPYSPGRGHRFNPSKLLLDPYARAIGRDLTWTDALFGYRIGDPREDLSFDDRNSAPAAPLALVIDPAFAWGDDRPPHTPWHKTVIYELHVRGFTRLHPSIPEPLQGTYLGLAAQPAVDHLKELGVTAVELMPVHYFLHDRHLVERGLNNYWGYNTLGYFAPHPGYASSHEDDKSVREFKQMVRALHSAGIEVILDVVYNHTAEGNHLGPTLSLRGIDNASYYRVDADQPRYYRDYTGCGNTLNMRHPRVLQMVMDSLRYWITEMHVDGFRFDLASTLARELHAVDRLGAFFKVIHQDPVISQVKLTAEPWDLGEGGYQVGNFPAGWTEWNGKYRDAVRRFWRGDEGTAAELATRLGGSADLYRRGSRRPYASVNYVTAHDGFTLHDLVSYQEKRNAANGHDNADGESNNLSWNCGVEGATDAPAILDLRYRQMRNFLATLLLSQGVPLLRGGDESAQTQQGNNNTYCQDNPTTWLSWLHDERQQQLVQFVARLIRLKREHPVFHRPNFFQGRPRRGSGLKDIDWLDPAGREMTDEARNAPSVQCLGVRLAGDAIPEVDERGERLTGDTMLLLLNNSRDAVPFTLPELQAGERWELVFDTAQSAPGQTPCRGGEPYPLQARSMAGWRLQECEAADAPGQ